MKPATPHFSAIAPMRALAALLAGSACLAAAAQPADAGAPPAAADTPSLAPVEVVESAEAQRRFDAAASHTRIEVDGFSAATPLVHLSELLAGQAGVVANDR